ncbi:hypothetical protein [uncultured Acetobacteroides sp.]|uniref:hypothetical protein n=1 Tax=uncultured Acetobacteroides sp. TaxID=1760811 RepID=UPI0029F5B2E0|nr:hypothetical protein [uncultured Acetobacteroides sp.]
MENTKSKESLFKQLFITRTQGFIDIATKRTFWQELATELGGTVSTKQTISKDLERLTLQIPYRQFHVEFTESDTHPLRISCKMGANRKFEFSISYEDTIEKLLKLFGQQDIQIGDKEFDKRYLIQGKDTSVVTDLLSKSEIKAILLSNNVFSYSSSYSESDNTILLTSLVSRTISTKAELAELFKLFCLTIDQLKAQGIVE